ncbi:hypothetical protein CU097_005701 [Rhizopus azygosporus]|uniref:Uncharacterized protein n=1 Tax=Rhizopus azygosporus TaxID=86630 RepID=A0A367IY91_RHIAZ|nr:hypothetical protein CU097_005701 [Rhizopus azygosporus]
MSSSTKGISWRIFYASREAFKKLKIFFLHASDTQLHLWSLIYCGQGFFEIWRESFIDIKPKFKDHLEFLPAGIQFYWDMKMSELLCLTDKVIEDLKEEHVKALQKYRYSSCPVPTLKELINPIILKLTQEKDSVGMVHLGPFYSQ